MSDWPILSIVTFLPLVGAALLLLINGEEATVARNSRWVALWTSGFTFLVSLMLWVNFELQELITIVSKYMMETVVFILLQLTLHTDL